MSNQKEMILSILLLGSLFHLDFLQQSSSLPELLKQSVLKKQGYQKGDNF